MKPAHARWLLFVLGLICGAGTFAAIVALLLALASNSGAGWQRRHQLRKGDV